MSELALRWLLAGVVVLASGWVGNPSFPDTWPIALTWALTSAFLLRRDRTNPGIAGFIAALDGAAIAFLAAAAGLAGSTGWLAALPMAYATSRQRANAPAIAPIVVLGIIAANAIYGQVAPGFSLYLQMGGLLLLAFALKRDPVPEPEPVRVGSTDPLAESEPETILGLRESFRKLKCLYRQLQWESRSDRVKAALLETRLGSDEGMAQRLATRMKELTGADQATIYLVSSQERMRALNRHPGAPAHLPLDTGLSVGRLRFEADRALESSIRAGGSSGVSVPLTSEGRVVGLCSLKCAEAKVHDAAQVSDELAPLAGALIVEADQRARRAADARLAELRLLIAAMCRGASGAQEVVSRTLNAVQDLFEADDVALWDAETQLGCVGRDVGARDWLLGETFAPSVSDHPQLAAEATRRRIGGIVLLANGPLWLALSTVCEGVIHADAELPLRSILADLAWGLERPAFEAGHVAASTFRERLQTPGILVLFEALHREHRARGEVASALDKVRGQVLATLPVGASVYVRPDGDIVAHLPKALSGEAEAWARSASKGAEGVRVKTASVWPRMNALIHEPSVEPDWVPAQSNV